MKRSEMEAFLLDRTSVVEYILDKIEAAGVVWDPEELQLPEKLSLEGATVLDPSGVACPYIADARMNYLGDMDSQWAACCVLREAVRRWNAWPELRRLAQVAMSYSTGPYVADNLQSLIGILDGKEGE